MNLIDLTDYAHSSQKIPSEFLNHAPVLKAEINSWKILSAHLLDFAAITSGTVMVAGLLKISFNSFMITKSLEESFMNINYATLTINFLPIFFMSYFFFSYFFNHGQTWGMNVMKSRIEMKEMSFRSSLLWAMFSSVILMTGGISLPFNYAWIQKKNWGIFQEHDHLYSELMFVKSYCPVNLVGLTNHLDENHEQETYADAA